MQMNTIDVTPKSERLTNSLDVETKDVENDWTRDARRIKNLGRRSLG
jgi:hypothetical protein